MMRMVAGSVGSQLGSQTSARLVQVVGRYPLLLISAAMLVACAGLFEWIHRRVNTQLGNLTRQYNRGIQVSKGGCR